MSFVSFDEPDNKGGFVDFDAPEKPVEPTGFWRTAGDLALKGAQGIIGLGQSAVGVANLATGGLAGKGMEAIGYDPKATNEFIGSFQSDAQKEADQRVQDADGFLGTAGAALTEPRFLAGAIAESIPGLLAMGGAQKAVAGAMAAKAALTSAEGAAAAAGKTGAAALEAAMTTAGGRAAAEQAIKASAVKLMGVGAASEGALTAGSIAQEAEQAGRSYGDYALPSLAAGAGTGIISLGSGKLFGDAATKVFTGAPSRIAGSIPAQIGKATLGEGLEELGQSGQEQFFNNVAMGVADPMAGVAKQAAIGGVTGAAMGLGFGGMSARSQKAAEPDKPAAPPAAPVDPNPYPSPTSIRILPDLPAYPGAGPVNILAAPDADSAIAAFTASLTGTDMGGIIGQANPLIAPAREMQAQAAADEADLADLAQTETRDLNTLRAQLDLESRKQVELDAIQATGTGQYGIQPEARPAVEQALAQTTEAVESPSERQTPDRSATNARTAPDGAGTGVQPAAGGPVVQAAAAEQPDGALTVPQREDPPAKQSGYPVEVGKPIEVQGRREKFTVTYSIRPDGRLTRTIQYGDGTVDVSSLATDKKGDETWVSNTQYERGEYYPVQLSDVDGQAKARDDVNDLGTPVQKVPDQRLVPLSKRALVQPAADGVPAAVDPTQPVDGALKRADVEAVTEPISYADARAMVAGKTEKPGGVDPVRQIDAGEGNLSTYRLGRVPLSMFRQNEDDRYDGTVDRGRAADYAARDPETMPPIIAVLSRKSGALNVLDGGHRITAARMRGDKSILTLVSLKSTTENPSAQTPEAQQSPPPGQTPAASAAPVPASIPDPVQPAESSAVPAKAQDQRLIPVSKREAAEPIAPAAKEDKPYEQLLALQSTKPLSESGGRKLYEVVLSKAFRDKHFTTGRGSVPIAPSASYEIKRKEDVTGNPGDSGYVLIDKREQNAARQTAAPAKPNSVTEKPNSVTEQAKPATDPRLVPVSQRLDPGHVGKNNVPLSDGGKPFKTNRAAKDAKKNQPMLRVVRVAGGFALAPKTEAQIAAQEKNAKRLAAPRFGNPGVPLAAHEFIAGRGGLRASEKSDMGIEGNPRVGNRFLFGSTGIGMDEATEALKEAGYLKDDASHDDARNLINRSLTNPRYTPEGVEQMAEREQEDRRKAFEAEQEAIALAQEAEDNELDIAVAAFELAMLDVPKGIAQSDMSMEDALLVAGYTQQELANERNQTERAEVDQGAAEAAPGNRPQGDRGREGAPGEDQAAGSQSEGLTAPTRADVLRQQAQAEAEAQRKADGGDKPAPAKPITGDVPDMFNTQGSVFDQPAEPEQSAITPAEAGNMSRGDIVRDGKGVEYYAWSARFGRIDVMPMQDGKPVVNNASAIRFALDDATKAANPEYRTDPLYLVSSALAESDQPGAAPATQAATILDAANVTGKDRLDILKDVKSGALTPGEVQAAFPGVEKPAAPAPKPGEVDNFGEALPPARRNMAAKLDEELADSDIANRPLSEIWPLAENQAIEDTFAAAVAHAARAEVPSKPRVAYKLKQWVQKVKTVRELAAMIVSGRFTREQFIAKAPASLKDWLTKVMLLEQIPRDQWNRVEAVEERPDSFSYKDGKQVKMPHLSIRIDGKSHWLTGDTGIDGDVRGTLNGNRAGIMALLSAAEPEERMQFEIRQRRGGKVFINKKGDSEYRALMEFDTAEDARKAITGQYDDLVAAWEATKARDNITERDLRSAENRPRAGKDHRSGRDVTPEEFQSKFGFRGGEFGKWVKQGKGDKERQAILNSAYDALMDLADIAGVPPKAISLNGTLGIAFGSRGSGWASAHFEPGNLVMNLTKTRGAGALAHEWFHALDNYFSRMRRGGAESPFTGDQNEYRSNNYITHRPEPMMVPKNVMGGRYLAPMTLGKLQAMHEARKDKTDAYNPDNWQRDPKTPEGVRPEVEARFAALVDRLNESPMTQRARKLDGVKSGEGYWSRTLERAARAFESYVIAKMHDEGYHNDFLVNVKKSDETGKAGDRYPYLMAGEVKPIAEAFDALFDTIQTKEDDAGNVAMFARGNTSRGVNIDDAKAVVASVREALPTAPTIYIMESVARAPAELRKFIRAAGAENDVDAAYHQGEIYVFPANIPSIERMQFVLAHHEIRHHGLAAMLGPRKNSVMLKIHESNPKIRALATEQVRKGYAKSRILATEEALADMPVADLVQLNGWDRVVAAVREWLRGAAARLRRAGLSNIADAIDAKTWTDKDVAALIARAEGVSRGGSARYASEGTVFADDGALARTGDQTSTAAFKKWFGKSKVVDDQGKPLVVYHGARAKGDGFSVFRGPRSYFAESPDYAAIYAGPMGDEYTRPSLMPVYLNIQRPLDMTDLGSDRHKPDVLADALEAKGARGAASVLRSFKGGEKYVWELWHNPQLLREVEDAGFDGVFQIEAAAKDDAMVDGKAFMVLNRTQIKSAIGNSGDFDATNPDIRFARSAVTGQTARQHTPEQLRAMKNVGFQVEIPTLKERAQALWKDAGKKMAQGIVDQFAPVKDLDKDAYALMRLSKGASGAFESFLHGGKLKLTDNVYDFDETNKGGVVDKLLIPLQGEHHDFMRWVAANRAERLAGEGKENLFSAQDIIDLKTLAEGTLPFDYKIQTGPAAGRVTRDRATAYADSLRVFNGFNKNILDMAEQSGLIDPESRKLWEHEFYVPFYRVADESEGGIRGANIKGGVVRQAAFKQLKGGKNALNADLLDNTLMNWAHLLDASAKNRAAKATIEAAERMGVAAPGNQSTLAQMATSINNKHGVVWFMDGGQKRYSLVDDPFLMTAITSLEYAGMRNPVMNAMSTFKHALTVGVTASPFFKIRNLIRDSVQVLGTSTINPNPLTNVGNGWKLTDPKSDEYFRLLAGGGTIHFGTMLEGSEAKRVQALVESGVDDATILGDQNKVKQFYRRYIEPGITAYNELGNRGEAINRASLYDQLRKQGMSHADASLQARDLMDFSMQGTFTTIRFLTQVVPFLNARLQGLYKLGRGAKEDPARFSVVVGAVTVMSLALLAAYSDDEEWKKREEWDRNNFFWFKFGGIAFRIPKPFEIGAISTLAERGFELAFDKEMTGTRFRKQVMTLLGDNLSMNPVPQLIKPIIDVYSNKDSFSGRPIETMSMERLKSDYRFTDRTSMTARGLSTGMNAVTGLVGAESLSPVQIDHMLRGYFGWLGSFVVGAGDVVMRPASGQPTRAAPDYWKTITGGMAADLRDAPSRYVSQMYEQANEIERAYGTWRALQKEGKREEAAEFAADNRDLLSKYRQVGNVKRQEGRLNERIRMIERSNMDATTKRELIRSIQIQKDRVARAVAA